MNKSPKNMMPLIDWSKTDLHKYLVRWVLTCFIVFLLAVGCQRCNEWLKLPPDNIYEEIGEEVIEHYTGIDVDLTPESKENDR